MATDAFTKNLIELSSGVMTKTGTSARATGGSTADPKKQRIVNGIRMAHAVSLSRFIINRNFGFNSGTFWNIDPNIERHFIVALISFSPFCPSVHSAFESHVTWKAALRFDP
jgi:hypothetical protein